MAVPIIVGLVLVALLASYVVERTRRSRRSTKLSRQAERGFGAAPSTGGVLSPDMLPGPPRGPGTAP